MDTRDGRGNQGRCADAIQKFQKIAEIHGECSSALGHPLLKFLIFQ